MAASLGGRLAPRFRARDGARQGRVEMAGVGPETGPLPAVVSCAACRASSARSAKRGSRFPRRRWTAIPAGSRSTAVTTLRTRRPLPRRRRPRIARDAAATPAASSCHDRPTQDHHGDTSTAFTCCATVIAKPSVPAGADADAAAPPAVEREPHPAQHLWHADHPRPRSTSPPLFVRHASLLL